MLDLGAGDDLLDRMGKVFQHEDRLGAGIDQLMLELARRVERIDVDDRVAGPEDAVDDDRILQDVRHHHGDAIAFRQAERLQPGAEPARMDIEIGKAQRLAH